ncbi:phage major capsid protein [Shewanella sp. MM_2022_3]|uniref:phage major capsid protein n=1 Tax=Shewanella sp. MM_2022_3 TaxID=2923280 RepID=UPI001F4BD708|nr:phage major capsid protein [Shewanella sp. MM_2022_3]MCH7421467.1 phage major capsid protein [Shewanella sp. MM_2022_3]
MDKLDLIIDAVSKMKQAQEATQQQTQADIEQVKSETQETVNQIQQVKLDIESVKSAAMDGAELIKSEIKSEMKTDIENVKSELDTEINSIKSTMQTLDAMVAKQGRKTMIQKNVDTTNETFNAAIREGIKSAQKGEAFLAKGLNTVEQGNGAEVVLTDFDLAVVERMRSQGAMMRDVSVRSVASKLFERFIKTKNSETVWIDEDVANAGMSNTAATQRVRVVCTTGKTAAYPFITRESINDSKIDIYGDLKADIATQIGRGVHLSLVKGDVAKKQPKGILGHVDAVESLKSDDERDLRYFQVIESSTVAKVAAGTGTAYSANVQDAILSMIFAVDAGARSGCKFYISQEMQFELMRLRDADGRPLLCPDISGNAAGSLFGFPVEVEHYLGGIVTGEYPMVFGNLAESFELLSIGEAFTQENPYSVPGNIQLYYETRVGTIIKDSTQLKLFRVK